MKSFKKYNLLKFYYYNETKQISLRSLKGNASFSILKAKAFSNSLGLKFYLPSKNASKEIFAFVNNFLRASAAGFFFELAIRGIGYKCYYFGSSKLFLNLGYSHYIIYRVPSNVIIYLRKNKIYVYSLSKVSLGNVVGDLCNLRIADAYKAKGLVEAGKVFTLKEGKKR